MTVTEGQLSFSVIRSFALRHPSHNFLLASSPFLPICALKSPITILLSGLGISPKYHEVACKNYLFFVIGYICQCVNLHNSCHTDLECSLAIILLLIGSWLIRVSESSLLRWLPTPLSCLCTPELSTAVPSHSNHSLSVHFISLSSRICSLCVLISLSTCTIPPLLYKVFTFYVLTPVKRNLYLPNPNFQRLAFLLLLYIGAWWSTICQKIVYNPCSAFPHLLSTYSLTYKFLALFLLQAHHRTLLITLVQIISDRLILFQPEAMPSIWEINPLNAYCQYNLWSGTDILSLSRWERLFTWQWWLQSLVPLPCTRWRHLCLSIWDGASVFWWEDMHRARSFHTILNTKRSAHGFFRQPWQRHCHSSAQAEKCGWHPIQCFRW